MPTVRLFLCRSIGANNAHWRTELPLLYIINTVWRNVGQDGTALHRLPEFWVDERGEIP